MRLRFEGCSWIWVPRHCFRASGRSHVSPKAFQLHRAPRREPAQCDFEGGSASADLWPGTFVADGNLRDWLTSCGAASATTRGSPGSFETVPRFGYAFHASAAAEAAEAPLQATRQGLPIAFVWGEREIALSAGENLIDGTRRCASGWTTAPCPASTRGSSSTLPERGSRISGARTEPILEPEGSRRGGLERWRQPRFGSVAMVFRRFEAGTPTDTLSRH
jgi:hypothetical protein